MAVFEPRIRVLSPGDAEPLLALWNAAAGYDPLTAELLSEKLWGDDGFDPDFTRVCEVYGALAAFGMAVLRQSDMGPRGVIKLLVVCEKHRRRGIGSRVLRMLEGALRERGASSIRICESPPNYLVPGVDTRCSSADGFLRGHGYGVIGMARNMAVNLEGRSFRTDDQEMRLAARGIACRRASESDRAAIAGLLDVHWPAWRDEVFTGLQNELPTVHIAVEGAHVLGFAAWDTNNRGTGWFGPMGTVPESRGLGIGQVLLRRCLADMQAAGRSDAIIPWVEPVEFYEKTVGAVVSRNFKRYEKVL